jgi:hypothetical protein
MYFAAAADWIMPYKFTAGKLYHLEAILLKLTIEYDHTTLQRVCDS